jgi:hypothetical protein
MIVVFQLTAGPAEVSRFVSEAFSVRGPKGEVFTNGVSGVFKTSLVGHRAYAVSLSHTATSEDRERIRAFAARSPLVLRLIEDQTLEQAEATLIKARAEPDR